MNTSEWFNSLPSEERKRLLSLLHDFRRYSLKNYSSIVKPNFVKLLQCLESDHDKMNKQEDK
jgi:hypothetical protein